MINARELRIGNWVNITLQGVNGDIKVSEIDSGGIMHEGWVIGSDKIYPVELTKEWLLRFGFEKYPDNSFLLNEKILMQKDGSFHIGNDETDEPFHINYPILYVHQLQNLHFAVYGEELQLNQSAT